MYCNVLGVTYELPKGYYVYVYLDTRKPGKYAYDNNQIIFNYEPIYVGKGKDRRAYIHIYYALTNKDKRNIYFKNKIKAIYSKTEKFPQVIIYKENLSNEDSLKEEKRLIELIGRNDKKLGTLMNLTDGGETTIGYVMPESRKKKLAELNSGDNNPVRKKGGHSEETKIIMSLSQKGEKNHRFGKKNSKEHKETIANSNSKNYLIITPENIEIKITNLKEYCRVNNLSYSSMCHVGSGRRKQYKGYSVIKLEN